MTTPRSARAADPSHARGRARFRLGAAGVLAASVALAACSTADPLDAGGSADPTGGTGPEVIVVGSQDYYSNEIIAEIYAQALADAGFTVERDFRIGQREAYLPEIESGSIDLFPEYTGPLLQVWDPDTSARTSDDVYAALTAAVPEGLQVLDQSSATDQDSYVVTRAFAEEYGVGSLDDLAGVPVPLTLGGNSEGENRPNGPIGLKDTYGVDVGFAPIEDGGGPLTVKALLDDQVQLAIIYTASPSMASADLLALEDPEGLLLASNVVPVASADLPEGAVEIVNGISAALTPETLVALNTESVETRASAATIARTWLDGDLAPGQTGTDRGSDSMATETTFPLDTLPEGAILDGVTAEPTEMEGHDVLRVDVTDEEIVTSVNGEVVLTTSPLAPAVTGDVGFFVDIGSEAFFRNLRVAAD